MREPDGTLYDVDEGRPISLEKLTEFMGDGGYVEARRRDTGADCTIPVLQDGYSYALAKWLMPGVPGGGLLNGLGPLGPMMAGGQSPGVDALAAAGPVGALISGLLPGGGSGRWGTNPDRRPPWQGGGGPPPGGWEGPPQPGWGGPPPGASWSRPPDGRWEQWDWAEEGWRENPFPTTPADDRRGTLGWRQSPLPPNADWPANGRSGNGGDWRGRHPFRDDWNDTPPRSDNWK